MFKDERVKEEASKVCQWVKEYVAKAKAEGVVIGNSGGKDSATVIAICAKALGNQHVICVAMPCCSNTEDLEDAKMVAETFQIPMLNIDITKEYQLLEEEINQALEKNAFASPLDTEASINMRPRLRMTTLYAIARQLNYLVAGTGNLCEAMIGYTTKWGDSAVDFNPIGQYTVEEVLQIGEYLGVPKTIIQKSPSDGISGKTDEEKLGFRYQELSEYIRTGKTNPKAQEKILQKHKQTEHKRCILPVFPVEEKNYFNE